MYSKYRNKKVKMDGYIFDSIVESERYMELRWYEKAGRILSLVVKSKYILIPKNDKFRAIEYEDDFSYRENGELIVEDVKPKFKNKKAEQRYHQTEAYRMFKVKQKLMYHIHKIEVQEV